MATSTATSSEPLKRSPQGNTTSTTTTSNASPSKKAFIVRPARLADLPILAIHHLGAFQDNVVNKFLAPNGHAHPEDQIRVHLQGIQKRYTNPAGITLVACPASDPNAPIAYAQFSRVGSESGVRAVVREKGLVRRAWLWLLAWVFWAWHAVSNWVWKDRVTDFERVRMFGSYVAADHETYWNSTKRPTWRDRWALSCMVVGKQWQGQGVGKLVLRELVERSERENVIVALSASPHGEHLYRKLGFELMGDFSTRLPGETDLRGGIMIRYPERWEGERHEKYIGYFDLHRGE